MTIFFAADHHFYHQMKREDGTPIALEDALAKYEDNMSKWDIPL